MKLRKMTFQVYVDQDSNDWHWMIDTLKPGNIEFIHGICCRGSRNDWVSDDVHDALMFLNNSKVRITKEGADE